jgi:drug/metabolite transporter (DMT)-like permease
LIQAIPVNCIINALHGARSSSSEDPLTKSRYIAESLASSTDGASSLARRSHTDAGLLAVAYGLGSAIGYTAANICLRSVSELDPVWTSCMKALPTVLAVLPVMIVRWAGGQPLFPRWTIGAMVVAAAVVGQLGGNVLFQWALNVIGLALDVPLTLGIMIVGGAVFGRWLLADPITPRMATAAMILLLAICILSVGASRIPDSTSVDAGASAEVHSAKVWPGGGLYSLAGVAAACVSGISYSLLSIAIRHATTEGTPRASILGTVCLVGFVGLGTITLLRSGVRDVFAPTRAQYAMMILAGVFNYVAFVALTKALHISSVFFVNTLNASQSTMSAVAGVVLFREKLTWELASGVLLTVVGLFLMRGKKRTELD